VAANLGRLPRLHTWITYCYLITYCYFYWFYCDYTVFSMFLVIYVEKKVEKNSKKVIPSLTAHNLN